MGKIRMQKRPEHIYISHSGHDLPFTEKLAHDLRTVLGESEVVMYDASNLQDGKSWWRTILSEISQSTICLLVCSPHSMQSLWVNNEIQVAKQLRDARRRFSLIPVLYQPCHLRFELNALQCVSFLEPIPYQQAFQNLLKVLGLSERTQKGQQENYLQRNHQEQSSSSPFASLEATQPQEDKQQEHIQPKQPIQSEARSEAFKTNVEQKASLLQTTFTTELRYGPIPIGFPIHLEGKYIAIIGRNASGKTCLLNALFHKNQGAKAEGKTQVCFIGATNHISPLVQLHKRTLEQYNEELAKAIEEGNGRRHIPDSSELVNLLLNHNDFTKQVQKLNDYYEYLGLPEYAIPKIPYTFSTPQLRRLPGSGLDILPTLAALTDDSIKMVLIDEFHVFSNPRLIERLKDLLFEASQEKQIIVTSHSNAIINAKDYKANYFLAEENDKFRILHVSSKEQLEGMSHVFFTYDKERLGMASPMPHRTKVFVSYSHKDAKYLSGLSPHLEYLKKNQLVEYWVDSKIKPGEKWQDGMKSALATTKVAILLISIDFLNSQFIADNELPPLLAAAESEGLKILPVILRPCILPKNLSQFQTINSPMRPLSRMKGYEREEIWVKVANAIVETKV